MIIGEINNLKVVRKSDLGYMLTDGETEVLMHFREATKELVALEDVLVFLYYDKKNRLCASMKEPYMTLSKPGFAKVVNVINELGVFIDNNCSKDFLVSKDFLPYNTSLWPQIGDTLFCTLKFKTEEMMLAKPLNRYDISDLNLNIKYEVSEQKQGYICRVSESGYGIISVDLVYVYVPFKMTRKTYRLGEEVLFTVVTNKSEDFYLASLIEVKEKMIDNDAIIILDYLKSHDGIMKYNAKSPSEEIELIFKMSRKAFKRALGNLYKEKKVSTDDVETKLIESN